MRAILLAAGMGRRIGGGKGHPPKCLLQFGKKSLLQRHLEFLRQYGVCDVVIGVGFKAEMIQAELRALDLNEAVKTIFNPRYKEGSNLTLWSLRDELIRGDEILLMDTDVLCDHRMIRTLVNTSHENCFLMDREFEPGEEPVKLCVRDGALIEFRKHIDVSFDFCGESVGFFLLKNEICHRLVEACELFTRKPEECYEEALREVLLNTHPGQFGYEDITGLPWIEIDFQKEIEKAQNIILPRLKEVHRE